MDALYFFIGGLVFAIGIFKRELLTRKESFNLILVISIALLIVGVALHFTPAARDSTHGALLVPLISLGLYRLCHKVFVMRFNREPRDTWLDWSEGMGADRIFNIVYFVSTAWLWMLITIGMLELAKRGW